MLQLYKPFHVWLGNLKPKFLYEKNYSLYIF